MNNYEKLKEIIQQANPEIMELKFGCEFLFPNSGNKIEHWVVTSSYESVNVLDNHQSISVYARRIDDVHSDIFSWDTPEDFEDTGETFYDLAKILGRPIRLTDVLQAMDDTARGDLEKIENNLIDIYNKWNLKNDSLDAQSDETKQFLIDLLVK